MTTEAGIIVLFACNMLTAICVLYFYLSKKIMEDEHREASFIAQSFFNQELAYYKQELRLVRSMLPTRDSHGRFVKRKK